MAAPQAVAAAAKELAQKGVKEMHGVVVAAGRMDKTVKVRLGGQRWEPRVQKYFKQSKFRLVHDPKNSVRQGDIVAITPSWREAQHVRHVVKHIVSPYGGEAIEDRPAVPTLEERVAERAAQRAAKDARRAVVLEARAAQAERDAADRQRVRERRRFSAALAVRGRDLTRPQGQGQSGSATAAAAAAGETKPSDVD